MRKKSVPADFSWGHLEAIKANSSDQGTCGSCWAHASRVTMQARAEVKGLKEIHWSTNQLIACTPNPKHCGGEGGCEGATAELAYEYVFNKGLMQDSAFRLKAGDNVTAECPENLKASTEVASRGIVGADGSEVHRVKEHMAGHALGLTGWTKLPENKEDAIVRELLTGGPLYVAVAAGDGWFDYNSGVMTEDSCDRTRVHQVLGPELARTGLVERALLPPDRDFIVNHAVVLFAWGVKQKTVRGPVKYWQIKTGGGSSSTSQFTLTYVDIVGFCTFQQRDTLGVDRTETAAMLEEVKNNLNDYFQDANNKYKGQHRLRARAQPHPDVLKAWQFRDEAEAMASFTGYRRWR
ncbi:unnamed protein product [Prorocentrum cordatum]|uniref:Peptidase C1A papain C-terminal domain-containing protein n=1 Tax=Prorocentrum cordatum TaxID=2364126 RepID=A0ABN9UWY6_9DINO|nr:unnamed protein product [Polarella glacialis]